MKFLLVRGHCPNCGVKVCWSCWGNNYFELGLKGDVIVEAAK